MYYWGATLMEGAIYLVKETIYDNDKLSSSLFLLLIGQNLIALTLPDKPTK